MNPSKKQTNKQTNKKSMRNKHSRLYRMKRVKECFTLKFHKQVQWEQLG